MCANGPDGLSGGQEPGGIRIRLSLALRDAIRAGDTGTVSALRSALSAIGNAEAVDPEGLGSGRPAAGGSPHFAGAVAGLGAGEAERRHLTETDVAAIVRAEAAERESAAAEYERSGHVTAADRLRHGSQALLAVLDGTAARP